MHPWGWPHQVSPAATATAAQSPLLPYTFTALPTLATPSPLYATSPYTAAWMHSQAMLRQQQQAAQPWIGIATSLASGGAHEATAVNVTSPQLPDGIALGSIIAVNQ